MTTIDDVEQWNEKYETVGIRIDAPVERAITLLLERPEAQNALNSQLRAELKDVLRELEQVDELRVLVITGSDAGNAFCAGADVEQFRDRDGWDQRVANQRPRVYELVDSFPQPVIARINGYALGGGCELLMACDIRIAHESAKLGQPEVSLGIMPGGGGTQRLPRLVGEGQAMRLILTGELIEAAEADEIGLVDEVYGSEGFDDRIAELSEQIADNAPLAVEMAKRAITESRELSLDAGIEYEAELVAHLFATEDKREGITAFLEDRAPEWSGR